MWIEGELFAQGEQRMQAVVKDSAGRDAQEPLLWHEEPIYDAPRRIGINAKLLREESTDSVNVDMVPHGAWRGWLHQTHALRVTR